MIKKFVYTLAAAAMTFGFAACSSDEPLTGAAGQDGLVTFTAQLPAELASRAFGEGENAKKLQVYVYEQGSKALIETKTAEFPLDGLTTTVELQLVNGKTYDILFWADAYGATGANTPYSYDSEKQTVKVDYTKMASNDDKGDAFFFAENGLEVNGALNKTITLTRPFAQINFGTDDLGADAVKSAFGMSETAKFGTLQSKLALKVAMPDQLNLFDGTVSKSETATTPTTFAAVAPVDEKGVTFPYGSDYGYLSVSYVLVGADRDVVDLDFTILNGTTEYNTLNITAVPVQRNYRTNIYGSLITSKVNFNVTINPDFEDPDYNGPAVVASTQAALDEALAAGKDLIVLEAGEYQLKNESFPKGKNVSIVGKGKEATKLTAPASVYSENGTVNMENLTYHVPTGLQYTESTFGWIQRVKEVNIKNCKFTGSLRLNVVDGGVANVENCEFEISASSGFDGYGLFYYAATGSTVNVKNCVFNTVSKGIIMFNESAQAYNLNVDNCTFHASTTDANNDKAAIQMHTEHGITGTLHINNCTADGGFKDVNNKLWNEVNNTNQNVTNNFDIFVDDVKVHSKQ